jgi:hypothetical protein
VFETTDAYLSNFSYLDQWHPVRYNCIEEQEVKMTKKVNTPKKGAARKWAERLKILREQPPSEELMNILNRSKKPKKVAQPRLHEDLDI